MDYRMLAHKVYLTFDSARRLMEEKVAKEGFTVTYRKQYRGDKVRPKGEGRKELGRKGKVRGQGTGGSGQKRSEL